MDRLLCAAAVVVYSFCLTRQLRVVCLRRHGSRALDASVAFPLLSSHIGLCGKAHLKPKATRAHHERAQEFCCIRSSVHES